MGDTEPLFCVCLWWGGWWVGVMLSHCSVYVCGGVGDAEPLPCVGGGCG